MLLRTAWIAAGALAAVAWSCPPAVAAPQVLGLVASNGQATPLTCDDKGCHALFSAFCLQQSRPAPANGDHYAVAPGGDLTLVVTRSDGQSVRMPAGDAVTIESRIGFTSVAISLPRSKVAELGAAHVAIEVGPELSLVPIATPGDPFPQSDDEVALATGPMRTAAISSFEAPGRASDAARITAVFINSLPATYEQESADLRDGLLVAMLGNPALAKATPDGLAAAQQIYDNCRISVESRSTYSLRNCLELRHADLLAETNHKFWKDTVGY